MIYVSTKTQEEYDKLMKIYTDEELYWCSGSHPIELNYWIKYEENTCVSYKQRFNFRNKAEISNITIITFEKFTRKYKLNILK